MRTQVGRVVLGVLLAWAASAGADDRKERLLRGEVIIQSEPVKGSDFPAVAATGVVFAPAERVWAIVQDCGKYQTNMPRISASRELRRQGDIVTCRVVADLPFPLSDLVNITRAVHAVEPGRRYSRTWTLIEGDYEFNDGSWTLTPFEGDPNRTLVVYRIRAKPHTSLPRSLVASAQQRTLPELFERLRALTR